jgi:hypothetical protein
LDASDIPLSIKIENFNFAIYKVGSVLGPFNYQNDLHRSSPPTQPQISIAIQVPLAPTRFDNQGWQTDAYRIDAIVRLFF